MIGTDINSRIHLRYMVLGVHPETLCIMVITEFCHDKYSYVGAIPCGCP